MKMARTFAMTMLSIAAVRPVCAGEAHDVSAHIKVLQSVDVDAGGPVPMKSSTLLVEFGPGKASPPHRHPGPVFGYVLEGTLEFAIEDGPVRTIKAGETFHEPKMVLHRVSRNTNASKPTKVLVVMLHPRDAAQLVIPESVRQAHGKDR